MVVFAVIDQRLALPLHVLCSNIPPPSLDTPERAFPHMRIKKHLLFVSHRTTVVQNELFFPAREANNGQLLILTSAREE